MSTTETETRTETGTGTGTGTGDVRWSRDVWERERLLESLESYRRGLAGRADGAEARN